MRLNLRATIKEFKMEVPPILYHATYKPRLRKILKDGLLVKVKKRNWEDSKDVICLANDYFVAESYAETSEMVPEEWEDQIIVLEVSSSDLDLAYLKPDSNVMDGDGATFEYSKDIPASLLRVSR